MQSDYFLQDFYPTLLMAWGQLHYPWELTERAANLALTALPLFALPGETSASPHFFNKGITTPVVMDVGWLTVPTEDGIGVTPELDFSNKITKSKVTMDYTKKH